MSRKVSSPGQAPMKPASRRVGAAAPSPVGSTAEEASSRRAARSPENRAPQAGREGVREIAWLLIKYRMDKGLSQEQLAESVGTSHSQISRIESGRHRTNLEHDPVLASGNLDAVAADLVCAAMDSRTPDLRAIVPEVLRAP